MPGAPRRAEAADCVILGAGCAGLSLAAHLAEAWAREAGGRPGRTPRVVLVDPRAGFARDRTWCFWDVDGWGAGGHLFAGAVAHRWTRWRVRTPDVEVERGSSRHPYLHVPADRFYRLALDRLAAAPGVEVRLGERALAVEGDGHGVTVRTTAGTLRAPLVFDSRPPPAAALDRSARDGGAAGRRGDVRFVQHFAGAVVRTGLPRFDPDAVTLMDFAVAQDRGLAFGYVLPFGPREALVEAAFVVPAPLAAGACERALAAYAAGWAGAGPRALGWREAGVLPMHSRPPARVAAPGVVRVGVAGGLAKPSTGYAFLAIQRDAAALARRLARTWAAGGDPRRAFAAVAAPRGAAARWLDHVFLAYLARHGAEAPGVFARLFARAPADALVRFLSDAAAPGDVARVVGALPPGPFAAQAARLLAA